MSLCPIICKSAGKLTPRRTISVACRSLRRYAMKLKRLQLVGGSAELAERRTAHNRSALVELWLDLEKLGRDLSQNTRVMLSLRTRGFEWKEIAGVLHMTDTAARAASWREVRRARSKRWEKNPPERRE